MNVDPKKVSELSEDEKMECCARWLNMLYNAYYHLLGAEVKQEYFLDMEQPCNHTCPYYEKCPSTTRIPYCPTVPIPENFKVLNKFTHGLNVADLSRPAKDNPNRDSKVVTFLGRIYC